MALHWSTKALFAVGFTGVGLLVINDYLAKRAAIESRDRRLRRKREARLAKTG